MVRIINRRKIKYIIIVSIGLLLIVLALLFTFFFTPMTVKGNSMEPLLRDGQIVLVNRCDYNFNKGDVIVFERNNLKSIKKIVAIEGDNLKLTNGYLYVNDVIIIKNIYFIEPFFKIIKEDEFFVLGENLVLSQDSFNYGTINKNDICGKVLK